MVYKCFVFAGMLLRDANGRRPKTRASVGLTAAAGHHQWAAGGLWWRPALGNSCGGAARRRRAAAVAAAAAAAAWDVAAALTTFTYRLEARTARRPERAVSRQPPVLNTGIYTDWRRAVVRTATRGQ